MTLHIPFDNSYAALPDRFYTRMHPSPVSKPGLLRINTKLADELGIDPDALRNEDGLAVLAGNTVAEGSDPLAQVYAGHQFGGWSPRLGDGRALLLGEVLDTNGLRRDIQLKGSGRTPYSRMGDGRAWLGPVLREYIVSEAMHALGIPTTRALAAVTTGETVMREGAYPGAVLTRIAASHIRVGTFQYFAAQQDVEALQKLTDHVIARHYPEASNPLDLLNAVIDRQANLVAQWMGVGFIHGVMNTDNTQIAGETIDYGPCAFMDSYRADMVYSSIDQMGRYAYQRQPDILVWNLAQFATSLLPLMGDDRDAAIEAATEAVHRFPTAFRAAWFKIFSAKIGLPDPVAEDAELIHQLLAVMEAGQADFTNTFRALGTSQARDEFSDRDAYDAWHRTWEERLAASGTTPADRVQAMAVVNPVIIPRNHRIEEAIQAAVTGNLAPFERLTIALESPFEDRSDIEDLRRPPSEQEVVHQTFCGT